MTIGNVNELYHWINTETLPDPLYLRLNCASVSSTDYTFTFRLTPMAGRLTVLLERMDSTFLAARNDQAAKPVAARTLKALEEY